MRSRTKKLLVVVGSVVVALVVANLVLAHFLPLRGLIFQLDDELLFTLRPSSARTIQMAPRHGGSFVTTRVNAAGLRGPELAAKGAAERFVVIGDSLVLAENVALEDTFVERLGVHLRAADRDVEVVNAGVTGYGPDQCLLRLERDFDLLKPDVVVIVLCATNDFGDVMRNKLFKLDERGKLVNFPFRIDPSLRAEFAGWERQAARPALARVFEHWRERRAVPDEGPEAYRGLIEQYVLASTAHYAELVVQGEPTVYNLFHDTYDADIALDPDAASSRAKLRWMRAVLERLALFCEAQGVELHALVVPSAVDISPSFAIRVDRERWPSYDPRRLSDALVDALTVVGVDTLDLYDPFVDSGADALFVGVDDIHWNARGQDVAAELMARRLLTR